MSNTAKLHLKILAIGIWESLQFQRSCLISLLDKSDRINKRLLSVLAVNGLVFYGSHSVYVRKLQPFFSQIFSFYTTQLLRLRNQNCIHRFLDASTFIFLSTILYAISIALSGAWYQEIATIGLEVSNKEVTPVAPLAFQADDIITSASKGKSSDDKETPHQPHSTSIAEDLYRYTFYICFYSEIAIFCLLYPKLGTIVTFLPSCCMYGFLFFDYRWLSCGVRLGSRLRYVESRWAFFAGFGLPSVFLGQFLTNVTHLAGLPGGMAAGLAACNIIFPFVILNTYEVDVERIYRVTLGESYMTDPPHLPVFLLALAPCKAILSFALYLFGSLRYFPPFVSTRLAPSIAPAFGSVVASLPPVIGTRLSAFPSAAATKITSLAEEASQNADPAVQEALANERSFQRGRNNVLFGPTWAMKVARQVKQYPMVARPMAVVADKFANVAWGGSSGGGCPCGCILDFFSNIGSGRFKSKKTVVADSKKEN